MNLSADSSRTPKLRATLLRSALVFTLTASGVVAFATIAQKPQPDMPLQAALIEAMPVHAEQILPGPELYIREERFQRGETLPGLLGRLGVSDAETGKLAKLHALQQLRPGMLVRAEVTSTGGLRTLRYLSRREAMMQIVSDGDSYRAAEYPAPIESRVSMRSGVIRSSLFAATDLAGIPDAVGMQIAEIFGGDVDFYRDLRKGDRFAVVYEEQHLAGLPIGTGRVLAAEFTNQGKTYRAVYFGKGYYTPEGKNLRKTFLRAPLAFSRVSSGFGMRKHPLHKNWAAHKGIDYAAPTGTRVRATSDGIVEFAGAKGGYGNVVILRHAGSYETVYAHLSRLAPGVKRGAHLAQEDAVGFVGQTGWATGPHLHYEFRIGGEARNPNTIALPSALPVAAQEMPAFRSQAAAYISQLELLANSNLALLAE
jgi:murein DD-endopeptidase MepM/ murein hydrolase activator NlpD